MQVWETASGNEKRRFKAGWGVNLLAFTTNGGYLAATTTDSALPGKPQPESLRPFVYVWGVEAEDVSGERFSLPKNAGVLEFASQYNPNNSDGDLNGQKLLIYTFDNVLRVWNFQYHQPDVQFGVPDISAVSFDPTGRYVATGYSFGWTRIWNVSGGSTSFVPVINAQEEVAAAAFDPKEQLLITSAAKGISISPSSQWATSWATVWGTGSGQKRNIVAHTSGGTNGVIAGSAEDVIWSVAFSPDGTYFATACANKTVKLWARDLKEVASFTIDDEAKVVVFNNDGTLLAVASKSGAVYILTVPGLRQVTILTGQSEPSSALAFSPDGKTIALGVSKTMYLRDIQTGKSRGEFQHDGDGSISAVRFSSDGNSLLLASTIVDPDGPLVGAFSTANPRQSTNESFSFARWNIVSKQKELQFNTGSEVRAAAFSPDGKYIAIGGGESLVRVFEVESGREVAQIAHISSSVVLTVSFSEDGKYLISGGTDNIVRVDLWQKNDLITEACRREPRNLTFDQWQEILPDEPYAATCPNLLLKTAEVIKRAVDYANKGNQEAARTDFTQVVSDVLTFGLTSEARNACVLGSVYGFADIVLPACGHLIAQAPSTEQDFYRGDRGFARARSGDINGAIEDLTAFVNFLGSDSSYETIVKRREVWIEALRAGKDPFDETMLRTVEAEQFEPPEGNP